MLAAREREVAAAREEARAEAKRQREERAALKREQQLDAARQAAEQAEAAAAEAKERVAAQKAAERQKRVGGDVSRQRTLSVRSSRWLRRSRLKHREWCAKTVGRRPSGIYSDESGWSWCDESSAGHRVCRSIGMLTAIVVMWRIWPPVATLPPPSPTSVRGQHHSDNGPALRFGLGIKTPTRCPYQY
jgi:hypothetical protein